MRHKLRWLLSHLHFLPARWYLQLAYWLAAGRWINWRAPVTFCDKLQWLKLFGRTERYARLVDKVEVRPWIAALIGPDHLVPLIGVYDRPEDIPWGALHGRFAVKCAHGSHCGMTMGGAPFDRQAVVRQLRKWQRRDWYWYGREPAYRGLRPRIAVEQHIGHNGTPPADYKVMCFGGRAEVVQLHRKSGGTTGINFFDRAGSHIPMYKPGFLRDDAAALSASDLALLLPIAERIAQAIDVPYVRVDLYLVDAFVYFSEVTFFDSAGFRPFAPKWAEHTLGDLINLGGDDHVSSG